MPRPKANCWLMGTTRYIAGMATRLPALPPSLPSGWLPAGREPSLLSLNEGWMRFACEHELDGGEARHAGRVRPHGAGVLGDRRATRVGVAETASVLRLHREGRGHRLLRAERERERRNGARDLRLSAFHVLSSRGLGPAHLAVGWDSRLRCRAPAAFTRGQVAFQLYTGGCRNRARVSGNSNVFRVLQFGAGAGPAPPRHR